MDRNQVLFPSETFLFVEFRGVYFVSRHNLLLFHISNSVFLFHQLWELKKVGGA